MKDEPRHGDGFYMAIFCIACMALLILLSVLLKPCWRPVSCKEILIMASILFLIFCFLCAVLFVTASMLSSKISQTEEQHKRNS